MHAAFSVVLNRKRVDGSWMRLEKALKTDNCNRQRALIADQLDISHMLGNACLLILCAIIAVIIRLLNKAGKVSEQHSELIHEAHKKVQEAEACIDHAAVVAAGHAHHYRHHGNAQADSAD